MSKLGLEKEEELEIKLPAAGNEQSRNTGIIYTLNVSCLETLQIIEVRDTPYFILI